MTIKFKLLFLVIGTLVIATIAILIAVNMRFVTVIDENQHALYTERVDTILGILQGYNERLQLTGQVEAYSDAFRGAAIEALKRTYYRQENQRIYPFIIDHDNEFVMHPNLSAGDLSVVKSDVVSNMHPSAMKVSGSFESEKKWYLYKRFGNWDWAVAYTVPLEVKYAEVKKLRRILISIMIGITTLSIMIMWVAIVRITKPIGILTQGARAIADGNYASVIDVTGSGELLQLTRDFNHMAEAVNDKVVDLNREIDERLRAEKALRESEEKFRSYVDVAPYGVFVADTNGDYVDVNPAASRFTGYSEEELLSMNLKELIAPESLDCAREHFNRVVTEGFASGEAAFIKKDGSLGFWTIDAVKLNANRFLGFVVDITQRKQVEEALTKAKEKAEESDRLKSAFLANMSHEIRTPMNGILGFANLLKEPDLTGEEQQAYIKIIEKSGSRMLNIINNIVDISKIEAGLMKIHIQASNVNEQIEDIYTFFKPEIDAKGLKLFFKATLPEKEATILTDHEKLYAILTNLVKNAIKYTNEGSIVFGYEKKGVYLEFFVKDTGIGIPHDRKEAIFERFIQADISDKLAWQGAGLGLSISKAFVEMCGGRIWVESEEGKGSIFYFTLPYNAEAEDNKVVRGEGTEHPVHSEVSGLKILIVEDDEASEMLIARMAKMFCKEILNARTGLEAIEIFSKNPDIDLIFMDIQIPEMDGYEVIQKIRQQNKKVVIIAQTAYALTGDREKSLEAGCNDYISKPIEKNKLIEMIQKHFK